VMKTADSNDITQYTHDDKAATGMFNILCLTVNF